MTTLLGPWGGGAAAAREWANRTARRPNKQSDNCCSAVSPGGSLFTTGAAHVRHEWSAGRGVHTNRGTTTIISGRRRAHHTTRTGCRCRTRPRRTRTRLSLSFFFFFTILFSISSNSAIFRPVHVHRHRLSFIGPSTGLPLGSRPAIISVS